MPCSQVIEEALPDHLHAQPITCYGDVMIQQLAVEADEMASFVRKKANEQWVWITMDAPSCQVIAFTWGIGAGRVPSACGRRFLQHTVSTPRSIPTNKWYTQG
jgi:hypothetical protein